jgi:heme/copper-type cytochrome/quinol oxidase subunit 2
MNRKHTIKFALVAAGALAALQSSSLLASAQCAMCKTGIMNSPDAARLAEKFNFAIFVLLIPPVLIFSGFFVVAYKYRKAQGDEQPTGKMEKSFLRVWLSRLSFRRKRREEKGREADDALA